MSHMVAGSNGTPLLPARAQLIDGDLASACTLVDTPQALAKFLDAIATTPLDPPSLYLDLEGDELSKDGTLTIIAVMVIPLDQVYIIDVQKLQQSTFSTRGEDGYNLKSVLECTKVPKVFFDIRNDSNALYFLHGISLSGVQDIQLMENASRKSYGRGGNFRLLLASLAKCIKADAGLPYRELAAWEGIKNKIKSRFDARSAVHVFAQRPLDPDALQYCAGVCVCCLV